MTCYRAYGNQPLVAATKFSSSAVFERTLGKRLNRGTDSRDRERERERERGGEREREMEC